MESRPTKHLAEFRKEHSAEKNREIVNDIISTIQAEQNMFLMIDLQIYVKGFIEDWKKDKRNLDITLKYYGEIV